MLISLDYFHSWRLPVRLALVPRAFLKKAISTVFFTRTIRVFKFPCGDLFVKPLYPRVSRFYLFT